MDYKRIVVQKYRKQVERSVRRSESCSFRGNRDMALLTIASDIPSLRYSLVKFDATLPRAERSAIKEEILTKYGMGVEWPESVHYKGKEYEFLGDSTRNPITGIEYREYITGDEHGTYRIMVDQLGKVNPQETL